MVQWKVGGAGIMHAHIRENESEPLTGQVMTPGIRNVGSRTRLLILRRT